MGKSHTRKTYHSFSLLEIILTIALLLLMGGILFPTTIGNIAKTQVNTYASQIATDIRYQQQRARNRNIPTGIYFQYGQYTLFDGETFASGTDKETKELPNNIRIPILSLTNGNSITFPAGEFRPSSYGNITLSTNGYTTKVNINMEGLIENE